ncbi:DNA ligase (ATP) [Natronomonas pharaonis DSM 2160]|uniref:DNA ligase n=1 Tax=Natronomonas pharaonis (strain ATCC 35678 / DSM 2160 / CIP 103997 / JCM 8858 / NBRC 14720 / NCIMB 2260 / Gabara) TaxID=348780 RepID=DNLI_NATPD|nr:ATP-dependent DNA ligase LigA [Natronomonas pharaonis]Q3IPX0.1 RecName: Full=DNA ligase; AltName: Full=Polydeoxyribonucleotide synthase [ATP] [Natronomonas pharaonis DSM 2160]CAI49828.1 DNA ligase (ATP) [Natronomonas pharaonis DSM 2160]
MEFAEFAARAAEIESEPADLETVDLVATLCADAGDDLGTVARFVQGRVFPAHDSTKLDIGPSLCYEALAKAAGPNVDSDDIERRLAEVGEIGAVAESLDLGGQQGLAAFGGGTDREALTVSGVEETLQALAAAAGDGSTDAKRDRLFDLFNRAEPTEARFLARLVLGEMRVGVGEGTVRDAIAAAFEVPEPDVERALQVANDCGLVAETARDDGAAGLDDIGLVVGRPVKAMLAQAGTAVEALDEWGTAAVETKYDGARVQVHYDGDSARLFSRNLEEVTEPLPEVVEFVEQSLSVPAILDGEVVAVDDDGTPRPFQEILRRFRRKHDVAAAREDVSVELYAFDCLHVDGEDLLDTPLSERHDRLESLLADGVSPLSYADDADEVADIEADALDAGHEGIMLKNPDSTYTPGSRGKNWLKRKPDVETLDLVVTGAEWGEGRRANLLGTFVVSARADDGYEPVGKVATGITDEELERLHERLQPHVRTEDGTDVDIEPAVVFEVGYEEIQQSPTYGSGYALRFPRFVGVREDKSPSDADSLERIDRLTS